MLRRLDCKAFNLRRSGANHLRHRVRSLAGEQRAQCNPQCNRFTDRCSGPGSWYKASNSKPFHAAINAKCVEVRGLATDARL